MGHIAFVWGFAAAVFVTAGLIVRYLRRAAKAKANARRDRHGFSGGTMLVPGSATFGHRDWGVPHPEPRRYSQKLPKFRDLKQLSRPSLRPGDVDAWGAKRGVQSRSDALRLLVGMALTANKKTQK